MNCLTESIDLFAGVGGFFSNEGGVLTKGGQVGLLPLASCPCGHFHVTVFH